MASPGPETVLGKTMQVLLAFTVEETVLGFAELQARTGLPINVLWINDLRDELGMLRTIESLERRGARVAVISPDRFRTIACPTYPDIRLALWPLRYLVY